MPKKSINFFNYIPLAYPYKIDFLKCSYNEALKYYNWWCEHLSARVSYVCKKAHEHTKIRKDIFDVSPESLILIWRWFTKLAGIYDALTIIDENNNNILKQPCVTPQNKLMLDYIITDITMYFGAVVTGYHVTVNWILPEFSPHKNIINQPVLGGFTVKSNDLSRIDIFDDNSDFKLKNLKGSDNLPDPSYKLFINPHQLVKIAARRLFKGTGFETDLLKMYNLCASHVDEEYLIDELEEKTRKVLEKEELKRLKRIKKEHKLV